MRLTGRIVDISQDFLTRKMKVSFEVNESEVLKSGYDALKDKEKLSIEVKAWRKKRSLDANAYCWVLIDRLATVLGITKEEVYKNAIRDIGGNCGVICVTNEALENVCNAWSGRGLGWQAEPFDSKIEGCTNVVLYYGSSAYTTEQMSRLIDNIVQDCKAQDIETMTPAELERLKSGWKNG